MQQVAECCGAVVGMITMFPGALPLLGSQLSSQLCKDINENEGIGKLHAAWAYPLNAVVNLIGVALEPIVSLVAFVAACVFKLISLCSDNDTWKEFAQIGFESAGMISDIHVLFVRIVYPPFQFDEIALKYKPQKSNSPQEA